MNLRRSVLLASWFAREAHGTSCFEWQPWQDLYLGIPFFGLLLIICSPPLFQIDWWIKEVDRPEKPYASSSPTMGKNHLEKETKEFQKPVFWNLTQCELELVHLRRRPRIYILKTSSSVGFVAYGICTPWGNILHTFVWLFFLMCPKYFSILLDIFSDYGKVQVLKIKPFLNFSKGILPSLIYIRVDEPTFTAISVKYSERLIHHSHRTAYKSLEMGEGTCVWSHAGWEEKGGCSLRSKVLNFWKQQGLQNTGNEFKRR